MIKPQRQTEKFIIHKHTGLISETSGRWESYGAVFWMSPGSELRKAGVLSVELWHKCFFLICAPKIRPVKPSEIFCQA